MGAVARFQAPTWPFMPGRFPWVTLAINIARSLARVIGCVLMTLLGQHFMGN